MDIKNLTYGALYENVVAKALQLKIGQPHQYITSYEDKVALQLITCIAVTAIGYFVGYIAMAGAFVVSVALTIYDDMLCNKIIKQPNEQTVYPSTKNNNLNTLRAIQKSTP